MLTEYILYENIKRYKERLRCPENPQQKRVLETLLQKAREELLRQCTDEAFQESGDPHLLGVSGAMSVASPP